MGNIVAQAAPNAARAGANTDITSLGALASINGGQIGGFRNLLINGDGRAYQWNNNYATGWDANDAYGSMVPWINLCQSGNVSSYKITDVANGTPFMVRSVNNHGSAQRFGLAQWIEGCNCKHLRGKSVTLSGKVRCSASTTIRWAICEWTGTEDTPSTAVDIVNSWTNTTFTAGQFFKSTTFNVLATGSKALTANTLDDITALTATVGSSCNNLIVFIWTDSTQNNGVTLDFAAQLEEGSVATAREHRPIQIEQRLVWRYEWIAEVTATAAIAVATVQSTTTLIAAIQWPVRMRVVPNGYQGGSFNKNKSGSASSVSNGGMPSATEEWGQYEWTSSGMTEGDAWRIQRASGTPYVAAYCPIGG